MSDIFNIVDKIIEHFHKIKSHKEQLYFVETLIYFEFV